MSIREIPLGHEFAAPEMGHYREKLIEHIFMAEVLQECAFVRREVVEVLHAEVDEGGCDIVFQVGDNPTRPAEDALQVCTRSESNRQFQSREASPRLCRVDLLGR